MNPPEVLLCICATPSEGDHMRPPLKEGRYYPVLAVLKCPCGLEFVDVGFRVDSSFHHFFCGCRREYADGIWWQVSTRFKRPDQAPAAEITITETVTRSITVKINQ